MHFSKDLCVGNRIIDTEHKMLFSMIDAIARSIAEKDVDVLSEAFDVLESSLRAYFAVEESIAQALNFDFNQHRVAHQNLLIKFKRIEDRLIAKNGVWSKSEEKDFIYYMNEFLISHIKEDGKPFKIILDTQFYDFKPG